MDKWLGLGVVLFVLVLSFLARKRSCGGRGGCSGCGSSCSESGPAQNRAAGEESPEPEEAEEATSRSER